MARFWDWLRGQKKESIAAAATLLAVVIAGVVVLLNASKLQGIFDPERFERFGNRQEGEGYDSVAGDGLESDLADRDRDGSSGDDEEGQKAVKTEGTKPQELARSEDNEGIGRTTGDPGTAGSTQRNPDAYEITDEGDSGSSIGSTGQGPSSGNGENVGEGTGSQEGSGGGEAGEGGTKPGPGSNPGIDPTPVPALSEEEQAQLRPRDPIYTDDGELLSLLAEAPEEWMFCVGDAYDPQAVTVRAVFRQNGQQMEKILSYGGTDGYQVVFSTNAPGNHTAIFRYHGLTATAGYRVLSSHARICYYVVSDGRLYTTALFPGIVDSLVAEGDASQKERLEEMGEVVYPSSGSIIDLTKYHRWMIAYLGEEEIRQEFKNSADGNYKNVVFLETDEDGYLTKMLRGFRYCLQSELQDERPYLYYPASAEWGEISRTLLDEVEDVPDGYKIRREVTGGVEDLPGYLGDQVLEKYTGAGPTIEVPMGVTKIALQEAANGEQITTLSIPESVQEVDAKRIASALPQLQTYAYAAENAGANGLKIVNGVLYSADGRTLLSVPPGMTDMPEWAPGVTGIAAGAFFGSQIKELTVPDTVTVFAPDCFAEFDADIIRMTGKAAPKPGEAADTGYQGTVLTPDSRYDAVLKDWMFAFADEGITFGSETGQTGLYSYDKEKKMIVYQSEPSKLAGIPSDALGFCQVPEGITAVGAGAFVSCEGLRDIGLPESVTKLEDDSLVLPEGVESLTIPDGTFVEISPQVFGDGGAVPELAVYAPEGLYEKYLLEWKAVLDPVYGEGTAEKLLQSGGGDFFYEDGAKYQTIPGSTDSYRLVKLYDPARVSFRAKEGTAEVAANAFAGAGALEIVYLPDSVTVLEEDAFAGCPSLQTVAAQAEGLGLAARDLTAEAGAAEVRAYEAGADYGELLYGEYGEVYGLSEGGTGTLLDVPTDHAGVFSLRAGTVSVNRRAFADCVQLTGLTGADAALTEIGASCFENCVGLKSVDLSSFTGLTEVGSDLFRSCSNLEELILPDSLSDTGAGMCYGCTSLARFHAGGLVTLGDEAFAYCSHMGNMELGNVRKLGARTFMGCSSVTRMVLPGTLTEMGEECFRDCAALQEIQMDGALTAISRYAFAGCRRLALVSMSDRQKEALRVVGVQAFADCSSLESVDFGACTGLQQMGAETFSGCGYLTKVTLPEALKALPDRCFADCGYLSILELLSGTAPTLGEQVFGDVLSPYLHLWVQEATVGAYQQAYAALLDQGYGEGTTEKILGVIDPQKEIIRGVTYQMTEEGRVLLEADPAVSGELTVLQDTVRIADEAFRGCDQLTALELPDGSRVSLGSRCFQGCSALEEVRLYGDIPEWGADTFRDCTAIQRVQLGNEDNDQILRIGDGAFQGCTGLVGIAMVNFRAQITSLGTACFSGCTEMGVPSVTENFRIHLENIEDRAFADCKKMGNLLNSSYSGLKTIGAYAFTGCDSFVNQSVPAAVTSIGEGCFADCDNLQTVSFYCSLEEYPKDCFRNCPKLNRTGGTSNALQTLKRIGDGAYEGCTALEMPSTSGGWQLGQYVNLEEIGQNAFRGCTTIAQAKVPASVKMIGAEAFAGCAGLQSLEFLSAAPPELGAGVLDGTDGLSQIRVPEGDGVYSAYLDKLTLALGEVRAKELLTSAAGQSLSSETEEAAGQSLAPAIEEEAGWSRASETGGTAGPDRSSAETSPVQGESSGEESGEPPFRGEEIEDPGSGTRTEQAGETEVEK